MYRKNSFIRWAARLALMLVAVVLIVPQSAEAQFNRKWVSAGSLHNWYSEIGAERESGGFVGSQQDGLRWPGEYNFTDSQAWKGLWIGARNVVDDTGNQYAHRVVHVGPRVSGSGEFFPISFELVSKHEPTEVFVDGLLSESLAPMDIERVDPTIPSDVMLTTVTNTLLGLTMERKVLQFSQAYHDDYHIIEYTFTNTGNTDNDAEIELPNQTLEDVIIFPQWRLSVAKETRYVINNSSGWGINTMIDIWGDGIDDNIPGDGTPVRAHVAWHGHHPQKNIRSSNIGGPILPEALPAVQIAATDTLGRLGAYQFVGPLTIHADTSPSDPTDDPNQPTTTSWIGSDEGFQSNNDAINPTKMAFEYGLMTAGRPSRSHAYTVEPGGLPNWITPTADPSLGTPGGFSAASGYGPYTLAPGESVKIVIAEAASGLTREAAVEIGRQYKLLGASDSAPITYRGVTKTKNEWVFTGLDSLHQTFRRAIANYASGYNIPQPPAPPSLVEVNSGGDRISVAWEYPAGASASGFEIYRAKGRYDSTYTMIQAVGPAERSFDDTSPIRGIDYYYYVAAVGSAGDNNGGAMTPAGVPLRSSRTLSQSFTPARLKRQAGEAMEDIRVVPNPYHLQSSSDVRWPDQIDKLAFLNIPGHARIDIFTELAELVDTIIHTDGSGDAFWDHTTSSRQIVASGLYIAVITDLDTGERAFRKFIIVR